MKTMIEAEKTESDKFTMIAISADGKKEYPQGHLEHKTKKEVIDQARIMYKNPCWKWNERDFTIEN